MSAIQGWIRSVAVAVAAVLATACGGTGNDDPACDRFAGWETGEEVRYRFLEVDEEWLVSVRVTGMRAEDIAFEIVEDQVRPGIASSRGTVELSRLCMEFDTDAQFLLNARERLILGFHSEWGTLGVDRNDPGSVKVQSCSPSSRSTSAGTYSVQRCRKHGMLGEVEPIDDDEIIGGGAVPGRGFVARSVRPGSALESLAVLDGWNRR
jgi:hypothetical protein